MASRAILAAINAHFPAHPRPSLGNRAPRPRLPLRQRRCTLLARHFALSEAKRSGEHGEKMKGWVHFVGIGGSGLSALAMLALKQGLEVSGSDIMWSSFMDKLDKAGAILYIGHSESNIGRGNGTGLPNVIIVSSAIPSDNEEVAYANSLGIPIYRRDVWLRKITEQYNLIAIGGTHGKSTTAAMLSYVLNAMGDDLIAVIGANVPQLPGGNIIAGSGPNFVLEADEYDCCFLALSPSVAVVTNVEWDHVDIFPDEEAVQNIFRKFVDQIKDGGHLVLCGDCAGARSLLREYSEQNGPPRMEIASNHPESYNRCHVTTYGISGQNVWRASSIASNLQGGLDYVLHYNECPVAKISLMLPGVHNVLNSLAVIATVATVVNDKQQMHDVISSVGYHLSKFEGVSRRFELIGKVNGCYIYDDYAHHPAEVQAVLQAARQKFPLHAIWVVFQPHTYSRLAALMKDFTTSFTNADQVIVTEVYAAREKNVWNSDGRVLATSIVGASSEYIPRLEDVIDKLAIEIPDRNQGTVIFTLGAGDITTLGPRLLKRLHQRV